MIHETVMNLGYQDTMTEIFSVESQYSLGGSVVVQVTGSLQTKTVSKRPFVQTFFLAVQENGYYVLNDIFRFLLPSTMSDSAMARGSGRGAGIRNHSKSAAEASAVHKQLKEDVGAYSAGDSAQDSGSSTVYAHKNTTSTTTNNITSSSTTTSPAQETAGTAANDTSPRNADTRSSLDDGISSLDPKKKRENSTSNNNIAAAANGAITKGDLEKATRNSTNTVIAKDDGDIAFQTINRSFSSLSSLSGVSDTLGRDKYGAASSASHHSSRSTTPGESNVSTPTHQKCHLNTGVAAATKAMPAHSASSSSSTTTANNTAGAFAYDVPPTAGVFLREIPSSVTAEKLAEALSKFGTLRPGSLTLKTHRNKDSYAFVDFMTVEAAQACMAEGLSFEGRKVMLEPKRPQVFRSSSANVAATSPSVMMAPKCMVYLNDPLGSVPHAGGGASTAHMLGPMGQVFMMPGGGSMVNQIPPSAPAHVMAAMQQRGMSGGAAPPAGLAYAHYQHHIPAAAGMAPVGVPHPRVAGGYPAYASYPGAGMIMYQPSGMHGGAMLGGMPLMSASTGGGLVGNGTMGGGDQTGSGGGGGGGMMYPGGNGRGRGGGRYNGNGGQHGSNSIKQQQNNAGHLGDDTVGHEKS